MIKKILIIAYACDPYRGSEHGVGWNWTQKLAQFYEIYVITRKDNMKSIEKEIKNSQIGIHFIYIDLPKVLRFWKKGQRGLWIYYVIWQMFAFVKTIELHKKHRFDAFWHLTFGNLWIPPLTALVNNNFIWGPVGGVDTIPFQLWKYLNITGKLKEFIRTSLILSLKFNPLFYIVCTKTKLFLARTPKTVEFLSKFYKGKVLEISETGTITTPKPIIKNSALEKTIIYVGRLEYFKGLNVALTALKHIKEKRPELHWKFIIIGDGPEYRRLQKLAKKLNLVSQTTFTGFLPREEVFKYFENADIFLFPSFREGTSWALVEAMSYGVVPIVLDIGGNSLVVDEKCGIKIRIWKKMNLIDELTKSIIKLLEDDELRKDLSSGAKSKVQKELNWESKIAKVRAALDSLI